MDTPSSTRPNMFLFYSRYSARLGGIAFGVAGLTILRLVSGRPSALLLS